MLSNDLKADLDFLGDHYYKHPEVAVRRWSSVECDDYHTPIVILVHFLVNAVPPLNKRRIRLHDEPDYHATIDIVKASSLREVLRYDADAHSIEFIETVDAGTKQEIAEILLPKQSFLFG